MIPATNSHPLSMDLRRVGHPTKRRSTPLLAASRDGSALLLSIWGAYLFLKPFYFFDSGLPQIADYVLILFFGLLACTPRAPLCPANRRFLAAQILLVSYILVVNLAWTGLLRNAEFLIYASYYVFNLMGCMAFIFLHRLTGDRLLTWTATCVFGSVCFQAILGLNFFNWHNGRATIFFNNPNQLGYYTLLFASIFWVWSQSQRHSSLRVLLMEIVFYSAAVYLSFLTFSRATIAGLATILAIRFLMRARLTVNLLIASAVLIGSQLDLEIVNAIKDRTESKNKGTTDELYYRGYDRMINHSQLLLFGAGEGVSERFESELEAELHSSLGTVLFCYGIVGLLLYLRLYWFVGREAGFSSLIFLVPVSVYGLTHNGLRQMEFWLLFIFIVYIRHSADLAAASTESRNPRRQLSARLC